MTSSTNSASYKSKFGPIDLDHAAYRSSAHIKFADYKEEIRLCDEQRKNTYDQLKLAMQECEKNSTEENLRLFLETKKELESWDISLHLYNFLCTEAQQKIRFG